ncbi:hypothetical protein QBC45DRAFT_396718 [Copromyces sp. CBS 386.78]|nr:hypothetical protein QBC45DRAFT_396718 [Copromyces sp. CBS 386.78]
MSEPRKTTMSPSPQAKSDPSATLGANSGQAQSPLGPSLGPEPSVSKFDDMPKSPEVPDHQGQHNEEGNSTVSKLY